MSDDAMSDSELEGSPEAENAKLNVVRLGYPVRSAEKIHQQAYRPANMSYTDLCCNMSQDMAWCQDRRRRIWAVLREQTGQVATANTFYKGRVV